ncbi:MAG: glycerophosphodiester phosphodiesterase [Lachnospiraceae bacterium]|nr:glycerophosphodiester phosphodiesterase [Lachnospiraceae bacterium]
MSRSSESAKKPFMRVNYAHRGLHTQDKSVPENSLAAFRRAREAGYGAELDVQLSKDGQVVVFHDDTLDRVCQVRGRVDAFTYEELHRMKLCGTNETIPLFTDVLDTFYGGGPLIVELKTAGKKNAELCQKTLDILRTYKGVFCIESFDPRIVLWFKKNAPDIVRGQLAMPYEHYLKEHNPATAWALSRLWLNKITKPDFNAFMIGERPEEVLKEREQGVLLIGWTSHDPAAEKDNDGVIFEFYEPGTTY